MRFRKRAGLKGHAPAGAVLQLGDVPGLGKDQADALRQKVGLFHRPGRADVHDGGAREFRHQGRHGALPRQAGPQRAIEIDHVYITPGLRSAITPQVLATVLIYLPVTRNVNGDQLVAPWLLHAELSYLF